MRPPRTETLIGRIATLLAHRHVPGLQKPLRGHYDDARAIVEAIREPTGVMVDAGRGAREALAATTEVWSTMVDAALREE